MVAVHLLEFYFLQESSGWRVLHAGSIVVLKKSAVPDTFFVLLLVDAVI
jgi:hypothetical protein